MIITDRDAIDEHGVLLVTNIMNLGDGGLNVNLM